MREIMNYLPLLLITMGLNILCGTLYNISVADMKFDKIKALNGLFKAISVAISFIGLSFVFEKLDILADAIGVTPKFVLILAITIYAGKTLKALANILGVKIETK